ncbi:hypothetical protein SCHPADRAFT_942941 [Schizopora paradoxa]|uniref:Uncharacterized protein n=1 Tax=Schizopora paradoxa TaxID=27342 RepID=A0A0H2RZZ4_9AGAM|nr:hypothetical protein SCHPADRAFT_942941 [Schizopora paradoxa]
MPKTQKRQRMEFEDLSDVPVSTPAAKKRTRMQASSSNSKGIKGRGEGTKSQSPKSQRTHGSPSKVKIVRHPSEWYDKMTKGEAKERFHLLQEDFIGLSYVEKPVRGKDYCAHMFKIEDVRRRAIELGRIPPNNTPGPLPQPIYSQSLPLTTEQVLLGLPGCAFVARQLEPWIWTAVVRYYEEHDGYDYSNWQTREDIAYQLRAAVSQLGVKYLYLPRSYTPLPISHSTEQLRLLLSRAPRYSSSSRSASVGIEVHDCDFSGDVTVRWARDYRLQVDNAVAEVIQELGWAYERAARWLVYDTLVECIGGIYWYHGHKVESRWEDAAIDALKGPFEV